MTLGGSIVEAMSRFRTINITDPRFEADGLRTITVKSPALGRRADISVFVPADIESTKGTPLIVLLHGVYGSHKDWPGCGGAHLTAREMIEAGDMQPAVVAMPSDGLWGDGSGYLQHPSADYENWILQEVPQAVIETIDGVDESSPLGLGGLSMGGYGTLRLGAKHPERFVALSAHSPIADLSDMDKFVEEPLSSFGQPDDGEANILHWMKKNRDRLPPFRFDCGRGDLLIDVSRQLHADLEAEGIDHLYEEFDGAHSWPYWIEHVRDTYRFMDLQFERKS